MAIFFRILCSILPASVAWRLATFIASVSIRRKPSQSENIAIQKFSTFRFGRRGDLVGYRWGNGPLVILVHGWGGQASQLAILGSQLALRGFQAILFDARGHGKSAGRLISFAGFIRDLDELCAHLDQPVHAIVGHSAGGLATMASRRSHGLAASHYVCLAAPLFPYPPIDALRERLGLDESALAYCRHYYAEQFGLDWPDMTDGAAYRDPAGKLLLVYDKHDDQIHYSDQATIQSIWADAETLTTEHVPHHRIPREEKVLHCVSVFLQPNSATDNATVVEPLVGRGSSR